jgi:hypothetical protein
LDTYLRCSRSAIKIPRDLLEEMLSIMHLLRNLAFPLIFIDTALKRRNYGVKVRFIEEWNGNAVFMGFVNDSVESRTVLVIRPHLLMSLRSQG